MTPTTITLNGKTYELVSFDDNLDKRDALFILKEIPQPKEEVCCNKEYLMAVCPCYKKGVQDGSILFFDKFRRLIESESNMGIKDVLIKFYDALTGKPMEMGGGE